eukprot:PhM_4_TR11836/c0_g1_i1/m.62109/K09495/CCT3, TRIC5; T-complex protein 1 subunit gamma
MQAPVVVLNQNVERETGRKAQLNNIQAAKVVSELIRSTLGPCAMLKMVLDPMGGIVLTNDGNCILREIDVVHPSAKHMIELSRVQDEEVGDGTTSVIVLAGELLSLAGPLLDKNIHPLKIVRGYYQALQDALALLKSDALSFSIDVENEEALAGIVKSCIGTKVTASNSDIMCRLAVQAVRRVTRVDAVSKLKEIDVKRYAKVEKIPGGSMEQSEVLDGVMFNKDVIHPKMKRRIENPRVLLLDCPMEYKKPETTFNVEITKETDFEQLILQEEEHIRSMCTKIIALKPTVVITEKGVSDLAAHFLVKAGISVIRRLRKTDNNRVARATGATVCSSVDEMQESDIGTECGLFEVRKLADEYFTFFVQCKDPKACSIILRGASKDTLNEIERNLRDAMSVARNVAMTPRCVYGAGSLEMELSARLMEKSRSVAGSQQLAYQTLASALEVIPRTLAQNCGCNVIRTLTEIRAKHAANAVDGGVTWGIDGIKATVCDVKTINIVEPLEVKAQALKTAVEAACIMMRIDDVVSGMKPQSDQSPATGVSHAQEGGDDREE